jgi:hypothetical protein
MLVQLFWVLVFGLGFMLGMSGGLVCLPLGVVLTAISLPRLFPKEVDA